MSDENDQRGSKPGEATTAQPHGGRIGQAPHIWTQDNADKVRKLAGLQISQVEICMVMGFSKDTIHRHYLEDFQEGKAMKGIKLRQHAYDMAFGVLVDPDKPEKGYKPGFQPSENMTRFMLERQFGMVPIMKQQLSGDPDGKPIEITNIRRMVIDPKASE